MYLDVKHNFTDYKEAKVKPKQKTQISAFVTQGFKTVLTRILTAFI